MLIVGRQNPFMTMIYLVLVPGERSSRALRGKFKTNFGSGEGEVSQPGGVGRGRLATVFNCTIAHAFEPLACVPYNTTADHVVSCIVDLVAFPFHLARDEISSRSVDSLSFPTFMCRGGLGPTRAEITPNYLPPDFPAMRSSVSHFLTPIIFHS